MDLCDSRLFLESTSQDPMFPGTYFGKGRPSAVFLFVGRCTGATILLASTFQVSALLPFLQAKFSAALSWDPGASLVE